MWTLTGFADEISRDLDEQIALLTKLGIKHVEFRSAWGTKVLDLTPEQLDEAKAKLDAAGIRLSSVGSDIGKIVITDPFEEHLKRSAHAVEVAKFFGCDYIRMFSFFIPEGEDPDQYREEVMDRTRAFVRLAEAGGVTMLHENEKDIYGDTPERCYDIQKYFNSEIKQVFDHANFLCCGCEAYPAAYELLGDSIYYMHIKDADYNSKIYAAGKGLGRIPETLADLNAKRDDTIMLTVEPHLKVFKGLDALEGGQHALKLEEGTFATSADAFAYAVKCIKDILAAL
mgnify:CR=1 FL=1